MHLEKWFVRWAAALSCAATATAAPVAVVATTSIVGDVVWQVGGEWVAVVVLFPPGADPHAFEPSPRDLVALARADVVFTSGAGLEEGLAAVLASPEIRAKVVSVSAGIELLPLADGVDPHVWLDPLNVLVWTENIERVLSSRDPAGAAAYAARAAAYRKALLDLDAWIQEQVAGVPPARRVLVADHWAWGYFAKRYGFDQAAAIVDSFSSLAEPSARELALLEDQIRALRVPAIFVSPSFNPALAARIAGDTGVRLVVLHYESLGPAQDYLGMMREIVKRIVEALAG